MSLPIPVVGEATGPQWAELVNSCLNILDAHDHSAGNGVQITPGGLNINSDLSFASNNATALRTTRWTSQSAALALATDLSCAYVVGGDLYFNDSSGNQIRITQSGAVAGTPGSISNLVSPASVAYSSGSTTFVFQSAANTSAYLDGASILLRNLTASSNALTLAPPNAMGSSFTIVLPSLPGSGTKFVSLDSSGNMGAAWAVDNSTLEVSSNSVRIKDLGVTTAKISDLAVTNAKLAALGQQLSTSCGAFATSSGVEVDVTNLTKSFTASGLRPVFVGLVDDASGNISNIQTVSTIYTARSFLTLKRGSTAITSTSLGIIQGSSGTIDTAVQIPVSAIWTIDFPTAGTYTYHATCYSNSSSAIFVNYAKLIIFEL